jgi:uncharacterized protein with HEPN domain
LRDIQQAIKTIKSHIARTQDEPSVTDDPLLHDALLYEFIVVGEAVKNLSSKTTARVPEVPWQDIAGLRDLIAHEYFHIDIQRVLEIVEHDLPPLEEAMIRLLAEADH